MARTTGMECASIAARCLLIEMMGRESISAARLHGRINLPVILWGETEAQHLAILRELSYSWGAL